MSLVSGSRIYILGNTILDYQLVFQSQQSRGETVRAIIVYLSALELGFQVTEYSHTQRVNVIGRNCITPKPIILQLGGQSPPFISTKNLISGFLTHVLGNSTVDYQLILDRNKLGLRL